MNSKIKNIIILVVVAVVLILVYFLFIKKGPVDSTTLTSSSGVPIAQGTTNTNEVANISEDFISLLLSVKSIKLDDSIFQDPSFISLKDSSITLVQDGNEGRTNPFAPIGSEVAPTPTPTPTPAPTPTPTPTPTPNPNPAPANGTSN